MPHISALKESRFLTKEDCCRGILCTIRSCKQVNVAKSGAPAEMRWCLFFDEQEKPFVLHMTNARIIAGVALSENTEEWTGCKIVLFHDANVSFGDRLIGGIRVRAPRNQPVKATPPPQVRQSPPVRQAAPPIQETVPPSNGDGHQYREEDIPF